MSRLYTVYTAVRAQDGLKVLTGHCDMEKTVVIKLISKIPAFSSRPATGTLTHENTFQQKKCPPRNYSFFDRCGHFVFNAKSKGPSLHIF